MGNQTVVAACMTLKYPFCRLAVLPCFFEILSWTDSNELLLWLMPENKSEKCLLPLFPGFWVKLGVPLLRLSGPLTGFKMSPNFQDVSTSSSLVPKTCKQDRNVILNRGSIPECVATNVLYRIYARIPAQSQNCSSDQVLPICISTIFGSL